MFGCFSNKDRASSTAEGKLYYPIAHTHNLPDMKTRGKYPKGSPEGAVIHYTAGRYGSEQDALNTFSYGAKEGHCYFLIGPTGVVYQSAPLNRWGYHAGKSFYPDLGSGVSKRLVGIEVACPGKVYEDGIESYRTWYGDSIDPDEVRKGHVYGYDTKLDEAFFAKFKPAQEVALQNLLIWLKFNNPKVFQFKYVLGHHEVSPERKEDVSSSFSWDMADYRRFLKTQYSLGA